MVSEWKKRTTGSEAALVAVATAAWAAASVSAAIAVFETRRVMNKDERIASVFITTLIFLVGERPARIYLWHSMPVVVRGE